MQAFIAVVQPDGLSTEQEQGVPDKKRSKEEVDPVLQYPSLYRISDCSMGVCVCVCVCVCVFLNSSSARFIQAVSELQFLGFIKPTLRKTDHVQRLTWGAC